MKRRKTLYMETTSIDCSRTAAEVCAELVKAGADQIATQYEKGQITGLRWSMKIAGREHTF